MAALTDADKKEIKKTLDIAEHVLGRCSESWADLLFPEPLRQKIQAAWPDVKDRINEVRDQIARAKAHDKLGEDLEAAGLTGKPLRAKTTGLFGWFDKFKRLGSLRIVKKILKWLNILLGSIPGAHTIKEHKEAVESGMEDAEDGDFEGAND